MSDVPHDGFACVQDCNVGILGKLHLGKGNEADFRGCVEQEAQVEAPRLGEPPSCKVATRALTRQS